jgi:DNA-binding SARP family transcriptional activator
MGELGNGTGHEPDGEDMSDNRPLRRDGLGAPGQVAARLVIHLLGEVAVSLDGSPLLDLTTVRLQRLLGRLALAPQAGLRRDHLAYQLWPDSTEPQARTNLRKLLHDLRRSLPDPDEFLDIGTHTVRWNVRAPLWVDVVAFTEALSRGDAAAAVRHYGGPLLPACYDDWVLEERERLRTCAVDALARLATSANDELQDDDAVEHARRLLRIDSLHEPTYRLLMEALARRGDRSEALRTYHRCVTTLERELGVGPAAATVQAYHRLRAPTGSRDETGPTIIRGPLIGRNREWSAAQAVWRATADGGAHFLLVTGEAGVGKTRLIEELAGRAAAEGHAVARTRAYEAAGTLPWGPVADWLRSDAVRPGVDGLDPVWLAELVRLLPELRIRHPRLADTPVTIDATRRHVLLHAVRRGLLAAERPLLLVVDDLQWCDADTLDLCAFLLQRSPEAPLLVAGTARDDEISDNHPLASLRRRLVRDGALTAIPLGRLGPTATAELAAVIGQRALGADAAARLWHETEGNPLFVVEAVRAGFGTDHAGRRPALTPTVQTVISARLGRLSPATRRLVEIAATIGREFTPRVLASAAGSTEDDIADALDELWHRQIIREHGAAYDFSHDKLRDVALGTISPARNRTLHRSVAAALEQHYADDLGPVSARLGAHYERAGLDARAVEAYERAAGHAYTVFALDDAIALQQQALGLLDRSPRSRARDEIELRLRSAQGVALVARRGYGAAAVQRGYDRALILHRRLERLPSPSVLRGLALHAVTTCRFAEAGELGHALVAAGRSDRTALVEGEYVLGVTTFWRGDFSAAEHHLTRAIEAYQPADSAVHIARYAQDPKGVCLSRLALTRLFRGQPKQADHTMDEALRHVTELDHPMTTAYAYAFDAFLAAFEPDHHDLAASVAALRALTAEMRIGYFEPLARLLQGWWEVLDGDLGGIEAMREVTDFWHREQPLHLTFGLSLLARAYLRAGDPVAGRAVVADALRWTESTGQAYLLAELLRIDGELLALGSDWETAGVTCSRALDVANEQGSPFLGERTLATLACLRALRG